MLIDDAQCVLYELRKELGRLHLALRRPIDEDSRGVPFDRAYPMDFTGQYYLSGFTNTDYKRLVRRINSCLLAKELGEPTCVRGLMDEALRCTWFDAGCKVNVGSASVLIANDEIEAIARELLGQDLGGEKRIGYRRLLDKPECSWSKRLFCLDNDAGEGRFDLVRCIARGVCEGAASMPEGERFTIEQAIDLACQKQLAKTRDGRSVAFKSDDLDCNDCKDLIQMLPGKFVIHDGYAGWGLRAASDRLLMLDDELVRRNKDILLAHE